MKRPLAITMGDPSGIGPEVALRAVADPALAALPVVLIAHRPTMLAVAQRLGLPVPEVIDPTAEPDLPVTPGKPDAASGRLAAACIDEAATGCLAGRYAGMVTGPISKTAIHAAGLPFPGHTEWIAARCGVTGETMLMYHDTLAVALATCHQSLASVPRDLTAERLVAVGSQLAGVLRRLRGREPHLAMCGFNPHAGEDGLFGDEDRRCIPALAELRRQGITCDGPLPPDTAFTPANRARYDGYITWYHDQGLIPFKALCFDEGVNVTMGLPIIRTSVDHGTANDIAWQGIAQHRSMIEAVRLAARIAGS